MEEKEIERIYVLLDEGKIVAFRLVLWDDIAEKESNIIIPFRGV